MFATAGVPASSSSSANPPISPSTASARPSRLRGLSALRNYTQNHLSLHHSQPSTPTSPGSGGGGLSRFLTGPASLGSPDGDGRTSYFGTEDSGDGTNDMPRRKPVAPSASRGSSAPMMVSNAPPRRMSTGAEAAQPESHGLTGLPADQMPTIRFIPYQDPRSNKPSLAFPATSRTLPHEDCVIRVGRYSERDMGTNVPPGVPSSAPVGFKSKVVSRRHCEFWCSHGQWYVKDVKSSSGTFLNHIRLSQPSVESRPFPLHDGDVVQLGIDFRGGEEQIFRCVKIRIECNRAWQQGLNNFNKSTHKRLKALGTARNDTDNASNYTSECSICLMGIAPCQSLFVAPCSHVWHFRCIRRILTDPKNYPQFLCPNCRAVADLEADIDEVPANWADDGNSSGSEVAGNPGNGSRVRGSTHVGDPVATTEQDLIDQAIAASLRENLQIVETNSTNSAESRPREESVQGVRTPATPASPQLARPDVGPPLSEMASPTTPANNMTIALSAPPARSIRDDLSTANSASGTESENQPEGPLTPRNEAGPFIFDGSGDDLGSRVRPASTQA